LTVGRRLIAKTAMIEKTGEAIPKELEQATIKNESPSQQRRRFQVLCRIIVPKQNKAAKQRE
jgi:hypothetical protein